MERVCSGPWGARWIRLFGKRRRTGRVRPSRRGRRAGPRRGQERHDAKGVARGSTRRRPGNMARPGGHRDVTREHRFGLGAGPPAGPTRVPPAARARRCRAGVAGLCATGVAQGSRGPNRPRADPSREGGARCAATPAKPRGAARGGDGARARLAGARLAEPISHPSSGSRGRGARPQAAGRAPSTTSPSGRGGGSSGARLGVRSGAGGDRTHPGGAHGGICAGVADAGRSNRSRHRERSGSRRIAAAYPQSPVFTRFQGGTP